MLLRVILLLNNGSTGVTIKSGINNSLLSNSIHSNSGIGIDLWNSIPPEDGITDNDQSDLDEGGNKLQNYPVLTKFYSATSGTSIAGYLESSPNKIFNLQFFSNSSSNSM